MKICKECGKEYEGTVYQKKCDDCLIETLNKLEEVKCIMCGDLIPGARSIRKYCTICRVLVTREDAKRKAREFTQEWKNLDNDEQAKRIKLVADKLLHEDTTQIYQEKLEARKQYRIENPSHQRTGLPRPCKKCGKRFQPTSWGNWTCDECNTSSNKQKGIINWDV